MANAPDAGGWRPGLRVVPDVRPGLGALGGIYTAVVEAPGPVVCVAWDMPFVSVALVQALAAGLDAHDAMLAESDGRRGVEPLCAAYGPACRDAIAATLDAGDLRAIGFHQRISVGILPLSAGPALRRSGAPVLQRQHRGRSRARGRTVASTRILSIIGRKNAGKTTLTVALASELARRGRRVMTIKHSHHPADVDRPGSDSWRHFHEGRAERSLIAAPDLRVLFDRSPDEYDPVALARRYMADADIVLAEGYKRAPHPQDRGLPALGGADRRSSTPPRPTPTSGRPSSPTISISSRPAR